MVRSLKSEVELAHRAALLRERWSSLHHDRSKKVTRQMADKAYDQYTKLWLRLTNQWRES